MDYCFMSKQDEKASQNPLIVLVDEDTGETYARSTGQKRLGQDGEMDWLVKVTCHELRSWGHMGGTGGELILKCDGESSIQTVRDAVAKFHGGRVTPEGPAKGESQSNGIVEGACKIVREFTRVLKEEIEDQAKVKIKCDSTISQWMVL